jgi:hypothetical protein
MAEDLDTTEDLGMAEETTGCIALVAVWQASAALRVAHIWLA